jgi:hypothetical protein
MLGTYAAALVVIGASVPVGAAVLALSGRRRWSWLAPALGLAVITPLAWWLVRLPGEGLTALIGVVVVAAAAAVWAVPRVWPSRPELAAAAPAAGLTLLAVSLPFAVEGHFGVLGTGFNVDMSQHLFAAEWMQTQFSNPPELVRQGYPVGPHALAVAVSDLGGGNLATAFSGVTIAVPVIAALAAFSALERLGSRRATVAAVLVAVPYLVASYLAQGAFKELFEAVFLLAFAIWLGSLRRAEADHRGVTLPGVVLAAGALYSYSGPGLVWIAGTLGLWAVAELVADRDRALATLRSAKAGLAIGAVALLALLAPELSRIADFGGSAGNLAVLSGPAEPERPAPAALFAQAGSSDAEGGGGAEGAGEEDAATGPGADAGQATGREGGRGRGEGAKTGRKLREEARNLFDDDLGNLFGDIPPIEAFGVWPTGDFRVEPGSGSVPAIVFYAGALLGLAGLAVGIGRAWMTGETAWLAGLAATAFVWLGAYLFSTPYTTAKALQMVAPFVALVSFAGLLDPRFSPLRRAAAARVALAAAVVAAAAGSSVLALANAPVGPERYTAGVTKLRDLLGGHPTLLLAPEGQIADQHGDAFYGWELRGARPACVEVAPEDGDSFGTPAPAGIRWVITLGAKKDPPYTDLELVSRKRRVSLYEVANFGPDQRERIVVDPDVPTRCELEPKAP